MRDAILHDGAMLAGRTIAVTAERRAHQQVKYLEARGAIVRWVPVLRTVEGASRTDLNDETSRVIADGIDLLIAPTGQALTWWLDTVPAADREQLGRVLAAARVMTRGSKASSAARRNGLTVVWQAPNELVSDLVEHLASMDLEGSRCAVLLDGNDDHEVANSARDRGADVVELDVYRYAIPDDVGDIDRLVDDIIAGQIDAVTFTSSPAIRHLRSIAFDSGRLRELDAAFTEAACRPVVVGPVCAATAAAASWGQIIEPATARLVPMLDAVVAAFDVE